MLPSNVGGIPMHDQTALMTRFLVDYWVGNLKIFSSVEILTHHQLWPVLQCFRHMRHLDLFASYQIRNRARQL
jgi:hypothetical protein